MPIDISAPGLKPHLTMWVISFGIPLAIFLAIKFKAPEVGSKLFWIGGSGMFLLSVLMSWGISYNQVQVSQGQLKISASHFYSYEVALNKLDLRNASTGLFPTEYKLNGIGLPGYAAGWFQMQGHGRVFALKSEGTQIFIPAKDKSVQGVIFSVQAADEVLKTLKAQAIE